MKIQRKSAGRGFSLLGMVFVLGILACVGIVTAQVLPTLLEYQAALKATEKAKTGTTVGEIRSLFDKAAQIDDIRSITGRDLDVTKEGDKVVVKFAYNREIHLFGPAFLLLKYAGRSK